MNGLFGDLFDFNGDGRLDGFEQTADLGLVFSINNRQIDKSV